MEDCAERKFRFSKLLYFSLQVFPSYLEFADYFFERLFIFNQRPRSRRGLTEWQDEMEERRHDTRPFTVLIPRRKEADECPQLRGGTVQENICNVDAIHLVADPLHTGFLIQTRSPVKGSRNESSGSGKPSSFFVHLAGIAPPSCPIDSSTSSISNYFSFPSSEALSQWSPFPGFKWRF